MMGSGFERDSPALDTGFTNMFWRWITEMDKRIAGW